MINKFLTLIQIQMKTQLTAMMIQTKKFLKMSYMKIKYGMKVKVKEKVQARVVH